MKKLRTEKLLLSVTVALASVFVVLGCCRRHRSVSENFPYKAIPQGAAISININAKGNLFIANEDGTAVQCEATSLTSLLKTADKEKPGWIQILGSYTLFQIKKDRQVLLCDRDFQCIEGKVIDRPGEALFSVNYDHVSDKLFIADANGMVVEGVARGTNRKPAESEHIYAKGEKLGVERLLPFTELIEKMELSSVDRVRVIASFIVFEIRGSKKVTVTDPLTGYSYVVCIDGSKKCKPVNGRCPKHC